MTKMIPELSEVQLNELPSQAEAKVYRALRDKLPNDYVVFFKLGGYCDDRKNKRRMGKPTSWFAIPTMDICALRSKAVA